MISKISFLLMIILTFCIMPISAEVIVLSQGSVAYRGETVDLSQVVTWPEFKLAWCKNDGYQCEPPDQVIQITGFMYNYYLDPAVWNIGTYYRWSGSWNSAENMMGMIIKPGIRPNKTVINKTSNFTVIVEPVLVIPKTIYPKDNIVIARGDSGNFEYLMDISTPGHLWLFGGGEINGGTDMKLDIPLNRTNNLYSYEFTSEFTNDLDYGNYSGYLQFDGINGFQDCYYVPDYKEPFTTPYPVLESPYKAISTVSINGAVPMQVKERFEKMTNPSTYSDDILIPITMEVRYPEIWIYDYYEMNDKIYVSGTTTLNANATMTAIIDPDHYALTKDINANTYPAIISGNINGIRDFDIVMPVNWDELSIGNHDIKFEAYGFNNSLHVTQNMVLPVSDIWVMPAPTPVRAKVIVEEYGWHQVTPVVTTATATATPTAIETPYNAGNITVDGSTPTPVQTVNVTYTKTTVPTPVKTRDSNIYIPLPVELVLIAIGISAFGLRRLK